MALSICFRVSQNKVNLKIKVTKVNIQCNAYTFKLVKKIEILAILENFAILKNLTNL